MSVLSDIDISAARIAKIFSGFLALLLFVLIAVASISGFLVYEILRPSRTSAIPFDLSVMMGHPSTFSFPATDGVARDGWFYPGLRGAPTIVVCHGYQSQRSDVLTLVTALQDHQFNVFLFDFLGNGNSPGITTLGYRETAELRSAVQALSSRGDVDPQRFGLWGVDMGGYVTLEVASADRRIAAFAVDDAYSDPRQMVQFQVMNSGLTIFPLVDRISDWGFRVYNYPFRNVPPVTTLLARTAGVPKLFIQSDDRPNLSNATLDLFVQAPGPKQTVRDRLSYSDMSDDDRKTYENMLVNFFLQNIPPGSRR